MFTATLSMFTVGLLLAAAGGFVGAAIGANYAFVMTGFSVLASWGIMAATGSTVGFDFVAFGPFFGPHIAFGGGVAAAAYAYKKYGWDGKDVSSPLASLGRPDVLLVGSLFGIVGFLIQIGIAHIPWFGTHTDSVALTVVISGILARVIFAGSLLNSHKISPDLRGLKRFAPSDEGRWLKYQEKPAQYLTLGFFFGMAAAASALFLAHSVPGADAVASNFAFAISAVTILFLIEGHDTPVTHHMTITAGLAALQFFPILCGEGFDWMGRWGTELNVMICVTLLIGGVFGALGAYFGELLGRIFYNRGASHIDPPALSIWLGNTLVVSLAAVAA